VRDLATGLALVLVIEGLSWAVAPGAMKRFARRLQELADEPLRLTGLLAAAAGVLVLWLVRG